MYCGRTGVWLRAARCVCEVVCRAASAMTPSSFAHGTPLMCRGGPIRAACCNHKPRQTQYPAAAPHNLHHSRSCQPQTPCTRAEFVVPTPAFSPPQLHHGCRSQRDQVSLMVPVHGSTSAAAQCGPCCRCKLQGFFPPPSHADHVSRLFSRCTKPAAPPPRIVLMGQGGVGKTAMTLRYTTGEFNEQVCAQRGRLHVSRCRISQSPPAAHSPSRIADIPTPLRFSVPSHNW